MAITNLTNTIWVLSRSPILSASFRYNINFTSNQEQFNTFTCSSVGPGGDGWRTIEYDAVQAYIEPNTSQWANESYRTIAITGGDDVANADLIVFLQANATLYELQFNETKTALKIYDDLTEAEYAFIEKDNNAFYLVNNIGVYKGEKLIATCTNISSVKNDILSEVETKQDKLTAGNNITIDNNIINATAGLTNHQIIELDLTSTDEYNKDFHFYNILSMLINKTCPCTGYWYDINGYGIFRTTMSNNTTPSKPTTAIRDIYFFRNGGANSGYYYIDHVCGYDENGNSLSAPIHYKVYFFVGTSATGGLAFVIRGYTKTTMLKS